MKPAATTARKSRTYSTTAEPAGGPLPPLSADALDDRIAIVGTAGSGKTYAKGFVERLLDIGARVAIVDPLGVWWGLRASADGAAAGYPVVVFGGRHADVPITAEMGAALGRMIASEALVCVVDLSELGRQCRAPAFHGSVFRSALRGERGAAASRTRRSGSMGAAAADQRLGRPSGSHRGKLSAAAGCAVSSRG